MAFTQEPVNYAVEYAKELANAYPYLSYFNEIWNGPNSMAYTVSQIARPSLGLLAIRALSISVP